MPASAAEGEIRVGENWGLATARLRLRRLQPGDGAPMFAYRSDPGVRQYQMCPESADAAEAFVASQQKIAFDTPGTWAQVGIERTESEELIGDLGVHFVAGEERQVELGFTVAPPYQRRGFAREATMALLGHLFEDCRKHRIFLRMDAENRAAIALATSLGFRKEGPFVKSHWAGKRWADEVLCALLRSEWGE